VDSSVYQNWPQTTSKHKTFMAKCSEHAANPEKVTYARVNCVEVLWGLIPVEYLQDGVTHRKVFHVLRTIPAPGVNLRRLLQEKFFDQRNSNKKDVDKLAEVCRLLEQVVNEEVDTNLHKTRMWGGTLPNPWALTDPSSATSVERLLSPFILQKIFNNLPGGYSGMEKVGDGYDQLTLSISGFPDVTTPESAEAAIRFYEDREEKYLALVRDFELQFQLGLVKCSKDADEQIDLAPILSRDGVNYNCLEPDLCMEFYLKDWMACAKEGMYREVEKLTMPKLAMALLDFFQFSSLENFNRENFIKAHVGDNNPVVTETSVHEKYRFSGVQSLGDFPRAGMYADRRKVFRLNADQIRNPDEVTPEVMQLYHEYMRLQLTTTWNGLEMDAWMSDRVHRCAQCVQQLSPDLCDNVAAALKWASEGLTTDAAQSMQSLAHDEVSNTWSRLNAAMCFLNKTGKANPLNLCLVWGMLCSDVLTYLGMHNESWRWVMFPILVAPGMGHLLAQTEDGHAMRGECIMLAKPNAAGLDEVVIKLASACMMLVSEVSEVFFSFRLATADRGFVPAAAVASTRGSAGAQVGQGRPPDPGIPRGVERCADSRWQDLQPTLQHGFHEGAVPGRVQQAAQRGCAARAGDDCTATRFHGRRGRDLQEPGVQDPRPARERSQPAAARHGHVRSHHGGQHKPEEPHYRRADEDAYSGRACSVSARRAAGLGDGAAHRGEPQAEAGNGKERLHDHRRPVAADQP
jgi:hypothetical protein